MARLRMHHLVVAVLTLALALVGSTALAQVAPSDEPSDGEEPSEGADLSDVVVTSGTYAQAVAELAAAEEALRSAESAIDHGEWAVPDLEVAVDRITAAVPRLRGQLATALDIHRSATLDFRALVALRYSLGAGGPGPLVVFGEADEFRADRRLEVLLGAAAHHRMLTMDAAAELRDDTSLQLDAAEAGIAAVRELLERRRGELGLAMATAGELSGRLANLEEAVSVERRLGVVEGSDLTFVALEAYVTAADTTRGEHPDCGLDWAVLAAIGRIESRHGTYGEASLDVAGRTGSDIVGIALDGTRNTREIRDTDGGRLDGDPVYDRAVGPMQFIPSTWSAHGRDGDGDGIADPHNLYDAAASAGSYLCRAGDFRTEDGTSRAVLAYNRSDAYLAAVLQLADHYRSLPITTG
jgi:membrane-bound lytic murein transglycosylase B